jgi:hypothetical protein
MTPISLVRSGGGSVMEMPPAYEVFAPVEPMLHPP